MKNFFINKEGWFMIEGIYLQNNIKPECSSSSDKRDKNKICDYPQYKELSKEANSASIAYATPLINKPEIPQISLTSLIKRLKAQGRREGKDFIIKNYGKNKNLTINNEHNKPAYVLHYDNGNLNRWNGLEIYKYRNGKLSEIISKHGNNKTFVRSNFYNNNEIPQSTFTKEGLTYQTTPEEFIETLGSQQFQIDAENNLITVSNHNGYKKVRWLDTPDGNIISISNYDNKGEEIKHITLKKDQTEIDNYFA